MRLLAKPPRYVIVIVFGLKKRYRIFGHYNLKDPLDELLFIICSAKTEEANYQNPFSALKESFPTHHEIEGSAISGCLDCPAV